MSSKRSHLVLVAAAILLSSLQANGQGIATPDSATLDKGKEVFSVVCTGCHSANHVTIQRKIGTAWQNTIYTMIGRGAQILPGEIQPLAAYLTANYGPASPLPVQRGAAPGNQQTLPAGGEIVIRSCGSCHAVNLIFSSRKSLSGWKGTIQYMRSNGARINEAEVEQLAAYLTEHFGPR